MKHAHNHLAGFLPPFLACWVFAVYWMVFGWGPLDRAELPLARLIHSAAGWSDFMDWQIIFFNRWWGEAVCVVLIYTAFVMVARQASGAHEDHRRILGFSAVILPIWVLANFVGEDLIEPVVARNSPSYLLGEHFTDLAELHQCKVKVRSSNSFPSNHGTVFITLGGKGLPALAGGTGTRAGRQRRTATRAEQRTGLRPVAIKLKPPCGQTAPRAMRRKGDIPKPWPGGWNPS